MNTETYRDGSKVYTYYETAEAANKAALDALSNPDIESVTTRRITETEDKYRPCPCGSGKKHKFCCWPSR